MKRISEITRRDIFDLLTMGVTLHEEKMKMDFYERPVSYTEPYDVKMFYWGRLNEVDFLKRIYNLQELPSYDTRFKDAEGDLWQHTPDKHGSQRRFPSLDVLYSSLYF